MPLALAERLRELGHEAVLFFDASAPYRFGEADRARYAQLRADRGLVVEVPSGKDADRAILKLARDTAACIITRDKYRDHRRRFRKLIDDPARLLSGFVADGVLKIPAIGIEA